jgi:hypothetical protein
MKKLIILIIIVLITIMSILVIGYFWLSKYLENVKEKKQGRSALATVIDKRHITFAEHETSYLNPDGMEVKIRPTQREDGVYRIYFEIENYNDI